MKYKQQALSKIEKIEHQVRALEIDINRGNPITDINAKMTMIKSLLEHLKDNISIEQDEWN
jgi:DNA-binding FrmR family transcriptional regulator